VATLDWLSGGRVELGVGYGWNKLEMANNGVDVKRPRGVFREKLAAMKRLWDQETAAFDGEHVSFTESWSYPKPAQRPHPPITIGATLTPATRQDLVERADGWMPIRALLSTDELATNIASLRAEYVEAGRDPASLTVSLLDPDGAMSGKRSIEAFERSLPGVDLIEAWASIGVDRVIFAVPAHDRELLAGTFDVLAERIGLRARAAVGVES